MANSDPIEIQGDSRMSGVLVATCNMSREHRPYVSWANSEPLKVNGVEMVLLSLCLERGRFNPGDWYWQGGRIRRVGQEHDSQYTCNPVSDLAIRRIRHWCTGQSERLFLEHEHLFNKGWTRRQSAKVETFKASITAMTKSIENKRLIVDLLEAIDAGQVITGCVPGVEGHERRLEVKAPDVLPYEDGLVGWASAALWHADGALAGYVVKGNPCPVELCTTRFV